VRPVTQTADVDVKSASINRSELDEEIVAESRSAPMMIVIAKLRTKILGDVRCFEIEVLIFIVIFIFIGEKLSFLLE